MIRITTKFLPVLFIKIENDFSYVYSKKYLY